MPAYYRASLAEFLADDPKRVLGILTGESSNSGFTDLKHLQTKAWQREIQILRETTTSLIAEDHSRKQWTLLLEYPIPRRRKRIDAVLLALDIIFCIEFKTEDNKHSPQTNRQAEDYALDLRDFHEQSHGRRIIPFAVVAKATSEPPITNPQNWTDNVRPVWRANSCDLAKLLAEAHKTESVATTPPIESEAWNLSAYKPTPTIVEAAEALFAGHNVREIAQSHSGAINLSLTSDKLIEIVQRAESDRLKVACFVTGVPGAGKTLAGLNLAHNPLLRQNDRPPAVFLSGNGPLVKIISAAITRDSRQQKLSDGGKRVVSTFIQGVHSFIKDATNNPARPVAEHVVIFDEAQRAWDARQNAKKMGQGASEPETMLSILDRHTDWAVLVALVGGGQEIHDGEAGLSEWGRALRNKFPHWHVATSPKALTGDTSVAGNRLFEDNNHAGISIQEDTSLHLDVCLRSFRAQRVSEWVEAMLSGNAQKASDIVPSISNFPITLTRSLTTAREWLRKQTRGFRRCGLVASAGATRLRRYGIELSSGFRQGNRDLYVRWFLEWPPDVRSSNQLEVVASEFECQGLELDWLGVCWGGDFTFDNPTGGWSYRNFAGKSWRQIQKEVDRRYLLNTYRVLLTRAREGIIIWIPNGEASDETCLPQPLDATAIYLKQCGLIEV